MRPVILALTVLHSTALYSLAKAEPPTDVQKLTETAPDDEIPQALRTIFQRIIAGVTPTAKATERHGNEAILTIRCNETEEYIVTGVQRREEPPWLFYATTRDETPKGHSVEFSSEHDDVIVDGRRFSRVEGVRQVVTRREGKLIMRPIKLGRYCSMNRIRHDLAGLKFRDIERVLEDVWRDGDGAEQTHATEPACEPERSGELSSPAR